MTHFIHIQGPRGRYSGSLLTPQRHKGVRARVLYIHTSATYAAGGFIRHEYPSAPRARIGIETLPAGIKPFKCGDVSAPLRAELKGKRVCVARKNKKAVIFTKGAGRAQGECQGSFIESVG